MFKHILLPATGEADDAPVFATALAAALGTPAHLGFLHVRQDPVSAAVGLGGQVMDSGYAVGQLMAAIEQRDTAAKAAARAAFAAFCAVSRLATATDPHPGQATAELVVETGDERVRLVEHGRTADLVVIGRARDGEAVALGRLQEVLGGIGRPLLIAAATGPTALVETVVIAWKDTAEAARAVGAAMPFLTRAGRVVVVTVGQDVASGNAAEEAEVASCARLVATLQRHSGRVSGLHVPLAGTSPVTTLLAAAAELRASLLVMGGYGHGELRERVFGGFTQSVLRSAALPVLMMH